MSKAKPAVAERVAGEVVETGEAPAASTSTSTAAIDPKRIYVGTWLQLTNPPHQVSPCLPFEGTTNGGWCVHFSQQQDRKSYNGC